MTHITVATWNAGPGKVDDLRGLLDIPDLIALAGQEWGDRSNLTALAIAKGWHTLTGEGHKGLKSTPLLVAPHAQVRHELALPILGRRYIGPGAGPDHNKPKGAVGARVHAGGPVVGVASTHLVASSYRPLRSEAAADHIAGLLRAFDHRRVPWFLCGDFNTTPDNRLLRPLYAAGWTNTHREGGTLATHGRRAIDFIWWRKDPRVRFLGHRTVATHSDHRALVARFEVRGGADRG